MDAVISQLALSTVSLVGKAAFGAASSVAARQITAYVSAARRNQQTENSSVDTERQLARLLELNHNFEAKISMLTPIIDLIDMAGARGNSILSMLLPVTAHLKILIDDFSKGLVQLVPKDLLSVPEDEEDSQVSNLSERLAGTRINARSSSNRRKSVAILQKSGVDGESIEKVCNDLELLLKNFDSHIPYLQLSLTASGISFGTNLASQISLSRLLAASHKIRDCDLLIKSGESREQFVTVGSKIHIRLYSLFFGSVRTKSNQQWTWTEKFPRAFLSLERRNEKTKFSYQLRIERDLDDGLVHEGDNLEENGIIISLPSVKKLFYSNAGRLLKIEDSLLPCLIVKFQNSGSDYSSKTKSKKKEPTTPSTPSKQPTELVWYAFEYMSKDELLDDNGETTESSISEETDGSESDDEFHSDVDEVPKKSVNRDETEVTESSISELEYMIRLANLETCRQQEHSSITDELLKFHLESDQLAADVVL